ncbi:histidine phosphatase family protein [Mycobacterium sp. Y57]|uniref:histidine phosphatase family protein n=1 Tax=Mycolicibacterium xanthum TaxID=2796469 RepID=UPI001C853741|nr:histidine phosphatase family protein [Mycolicibacterium xanthum]MBX7432457.1 histidine phosphatase family protein [Mycolicibacterium xanthum]
MGVVYLVRHGQARATAYGAGALSPEMGGLTELGRAQAECTGSALAGRIGSLDWAESGDLVRQRQTLDLILPAAGDGLSAAGHSHWDEYDMDAILGRDGRAVSMSGQDLQRDVDDALAEWVAGGAPAAGGETYAQYRDRCAAALASVLPRAGRGQTVVVASSSGTITQVLAGLWGLDGPSWIRLSRTMINASITKLIVGRQGASVISVNEHGHLEKTTADGRSMMTFR